MRIGQCGFAGHVDHEQTDLDNYCKRIIYTIALRLAVGLLRLRFFPCAKALALLRYVLVDPLA